MENKLDQATGAIKMKDFGKVTGDSRKEEAEGAVEKTVARAKGALKMLKGAVEECR